MRIYDLATPISLILLLALGNIRRASTFNYQFQFQNKNPTNYSRNIFSAVARTEQCPFLKNRRCNSIQITAARSSDNYLRPQLTMRYDSRHIGKNVVKNHSCRRMYPTGDIGIWNRVGGDDLLSTRRRTTALDGVKFKNFDTMLETFCDRLVLVDFHAKWCGPCRHVQKELQIVRDTFGGVVKVFNVDTEKFPSLGTRFNIDVLPTLLLFKGSEEVLRIEGIETAENIITKIKDHL